MLHVHNGDCSAEILKQSSLPGEHFAWREALIAGPAPENLTLDEWKAVRADFLAREYELDVEDCRKNLTKQYEALLSFSNHEEVVLWFEHDLFCQLNMVYLLNWFSERELGKTILSLVCIGEFPGFDNFKGLGQLSPEQMESLFDKRHEVTDQEKTVAAQAWRAYCSPNPKMIQELLNKNLSALPFLKEALLRHLNRFPSTRNGLGRIENRALELIDAGFNNFIPLFTEFGSKEPAYGYGDFQFWCDLKRIARAGEPLLSIGKIDDLDNLDKAISYHKVNQTSFKITDRGKAVLAGEEDFVEANGIDLWLGGVHLCDNEVLWRWDDQKQELNRV